MKYICLFLAILLTVIWISSRISAIVIYCVEHRFEEMPSMILNIINIILLSIFWTLFIVF